MIESDVVIFYGNEIVARPLKDDMLTPVFDAIKARTAANEERSIFGETVTGGEKFLTYYRPLVNNGNEGFVTLFMFTSLTKHKSELLGVIAKGVAIAALGLGVCAALMFLLIASVARRVTAMTATEFMVADGNLDVAFEVMEDDEIGRLGRSMQIVANKMNKLLDDISWMMNEHNKGNLYHRFDSDQFSGKFKMLADNILNLTDLNTKDMLTGLPNRRCFYIRLLSERSQAIEKKLPISILMIDIDRFKHFDNEVGNAILQSVSAIFSKAIITDVDMVARWEMDVFIALLPNTDLSRAQYVAEQIRSRVENATFHGHDPDSAVNVTVSIGGHTRMLTHSDANDYLHLISMANKALHNAKEAGRNRVSFLGDGQDS
jgi:diguanylate cyclase (GGDEF)-like protein